MAWLPTLFVVLLTAAALTEADSPPATPALRRLWMAGILLLGLLALVSSVAGERRTAELIADARRSAVLPAGNSTDHSEANTAELASQVEILKTRVRELEENVEVRMINAAVAAKFSEYLRQVGAHSVIVSCIPDSIEAYNYANQIVNILRSANWDARGPEITKVFGDIRAIGINIYSGDNNNAEVVKILLDGFTKFNIPYHIRVAPSGSVPDSETVELFIGARPSESAKAASN